MENSVRYSSGSGFCRFFRAGLDEEDIMTSKEIRIGLSSGLEARPAAVSYTHLEVKMLGF